MHGECREECIEVQVLRVFAIDNLFRCPGFPTYIKTGHLGVSARTLGAVVPEQLADLCAGRGLQDTSAGDLVMPPTVGDEGRVPKYATVYEGRRSRSRL